MKTYPVTGQPPGYAVTDVDELAVGRLVWVRAFGRWRTGPVTSVGRTRAQVRVERNADGDQATNAYPLERIRHCHWPPWA